MKLIGNLLIVAGIAFIAIFGYQLWSHNNAQDNALVEAQERVKEAPQQDTTENYEKSAQEFSAEHGDSIGLLEIPKLDREIAIVEGVDEDSLKQGVGHIPNTALPYQKEQIVLSGHRDTVFRDFGELEIGDRFIVHMPYGSFEYEIREDEIVPEDDTSVIGRHDSEVLVVSTCYPFHIVGPAPDRYVTYAYPVD